MKDYKQVVVDRYNSAENNRKKDLYSKLSNTGRLGWITWVCFLGDYISYVKNSTSKELENLCFMDCGCGNGEVTRHISEYLGSNRNVCGFEFSEVRLEECKKRNCEIEYKSGDLSERIPEFDTAEKFDGIIASVVFMHLRTRQDVIQGLKNICEKLSDNGVFMWLDANADSHYIEDDRDFRGFSQEEMIEHAREAGMVMVKKFKYNPILPKIGPLYYYKGNKIPEGLKLFLQYHNKPFKCLNNVMYFKKI